MKKAKSQVKESRPEFWITLVAVLCVLVAFAVLLLASGKRIDGQIVAQGEIRRGGQAVFTYQPQKAKVGDKVVWFVNGQQVETGVYDGEKTEFCYVPQQTGRVFVRACVGKYCQAADFDVQKPVLTVRAIDATATYGDEMPNLTFECSGLLDCDTLESQNLNFCCQTHCDSLGCCGEGEIFFEEGNYDQCDYEVRLEKGRFCVLPREICVKSVQKTYDQTDVLQNPELELLGVLPGDEVTAKCEKLHFESKNAGKQTISSAEIELCGKDSANYVLKEEIEGEILPRQVFLHGMMVADKPFDGTTRALVAKLGKLLGVVDGDSVAVGSLEVRFDGAGVGRHKVVVQNVCLVGMDKDNYFLADVTTPEANILSR